MCNASTRHFLENVICVILERCPSGAEVQMVPGRCVTPVAFVHIACHVTTCTQLGSLLIAYAKLIRKCYKMLAAESGSGTMVLIDMEMLCTSARAAENRNGEMNKMSIHMGTFQVMPTNTNINSKSGSAHGQQAPLITQAQLPSQPQPSQPLTTQLPPLVNSSGTPHLHPHGVGSGQRHLLVPSQGNAMTYLTTTLTNTHLDSMVALDCTNPPWDTVISVSKLPHQDRHLCQYVSQTESIPSSRATARYINASRGDRL